jgi:tetratricopeptide (TPR) repeat protein
VAQAGAVYREIFETRRSSLGENHPETLRAMNNLAVVLRRAGALDEAEALLLELIAVRSASLGRDHLDTLRARSSLALVRERQGRLPEVEAEWTDILELRTDNLGPDHRDTLRSAVHLARIRAALADWPGAAEALQQAASNGLDPSRVLEAPEFEALRARPEFAPVAELLAN